MITDSRSGAAAGSSVSAIQASMLRSTRDWLTPPSSRSPIHRYRNTAASARTRLQKRKRCMRLLSSRLIVLCARMYSKSSRSPRTDTMPYSRFFSEYPVFGSSRIGYTAMRET